ncbi:MAG: Trm112 family protein [Candidatus Omnitrophica bacterium]|nr:Trm112 family protein [Candidatus Omnitrophota bacterium]
MIDKDLLDILACPETKKDVELADEKTVTVINKAISEGRVRNKLQQKVDQPIEGGLFRVGDKSCIYPIRDHIPVLLVDELIILTGIIDQ